MHDQGCNAGQKVILNLKLYLIFYEKNSSGIVYKYTVSICAVFVQYFVFAITKYFKNTFI